MSNNQRTIRNGQTDMKIELLEIKSVVVEEEFWKPERKGRPPTKEWKLG